MNVEEQLREYRTVLDAATEEAAADASTEHAVVPIRVRPARTLIVAAVAVAAAVAIAFAVVGTTNKRSTPPAGVTTTPAPSTTRELPATSFVPNVVGLTNDAAQTAIGQSGFDLTATSVSCTSGAPDHVRAQQPAPGTRAPRGSTVSIEVCGGQPRVATLPVTVCDTQQALAPSPTDPHAPATLPIVAPPFSTPRLAAYGDTRGYLLVPAPAGWNCKALEAGDGGQAVGITPPGSVPRDSWGNPGHVTKPLTDGVFATSIPACQGCVYDEICGIVPTAAADFPSDASLPCTRPRGEHVVRRSVTLYEFDDPAGTIGPDAAISYLRYSAPTPTSDAAVARETCILPASERAVCDALLADFSQRHARAAAPTWSDPALSIGPHGLGSVAVGQSIEDAIQSAGFAFDGRGDGFMYSRAHDRTGMHLYIGLDGREHVGCVGAEIVIAPHAPAQTVTTVDGFTLGGTVQQLLAIYGSRAKFVRAPASGMTTNAGYVVEERGGALAFAVYQNKVFEIAGGAAGITPNSCTG